MGLISIVDLVAEDDRETAVELRQARRVLRLRAFDDCIDRGVACGRVRVDDIAVGVIDAMCMNTSS